MALRMPWYTCRDFRETAAMAGLGDSYAAVKEALQVPLLYPIQPQLFQIMIYCA